MPGPVLKAGTWWWANPRACLQGAPSSDPGTIVTGQRNTSLDHTILTCKPLCKPPPCRAQQMQFTKLYLHLLGPARAPSGNCPYHGFIPQVHHSGLTYWKAWLLGHLGWGGVWVVGGPAGSSNTWTSMDVQLTWCFWSSWTYLVISSSVWLWASFWFFPAWRIKAQSSGCWGKPVRDLTNIHLLGSHISHLTYRRRGYCVS